MRSICAFWFLFFVLFLFRTLLLFEWVPRSDLCSSSDSNDAEYEATRRQITDLAVRIHAEYQRKEENSAKLSESEFALKAIVDDVISRLMLRDQVAAQKGGQV